MSGSWDLRVVAVVALRHLADGGGVGGGSDDGTMNRRTHWRGVGRREGGCRGCILAEVGVEELGWSVVRVVDVLGG